jgi:hypothetical protein
MQKRINGKIYDTETATKICRQNSLLPTTLYRTDEGEYFVSSWYLCLLSLEEAKDFAATCLDGIQYKALFGQEKPEFWYACLDYVEDTDLRIGSTCYDTAVQMAKEGHCQAIAVVRLEDDPLCPTILTDF